MDYTNELYELCEAISREIADANEKIRSAGGKLTAGDVDYIDKLTHTLKSIKATIAMMEDEGYSSYDDGGSYENRGGGGGRSSYMMGGSYARGGRSNNRGGGSYARGGGSYARGGRGGNNRYSRDAGLVEELRGLMEDAPNEQIKREMQKLVEKVEQQM